MKELSIVLDRYDRVISPNGLGAGARGKHAPAGRAARKFSFC